MTTLKIPDLDLFHHRKTTHHTADRNYQAATKKLQQSRSRAYYDTNIPHRQYQNAPIISNTRSYSHNRYKSIAQDYLQRRPQIPLYYLEPTPIIPPLAPSLHTYTFQNSAKNSRKNPCQCQNQPNCNDYYYPSHKTYNQTLINNPYTGKNQQSMRKSKDPKLIKDPYLAPTFRDMGGFRQKQNKSIYKQQKHKDKSQMDDSKIIQKLKTHQSNEQQEQKRFIKHSIDNKSAYIQTEKQIHNSSLVEATKVVIPPQNKSKVNVEAILLQQNRLMESLKYEYERESPYKNQLQGLQQTKDHYIEKSRELLLKLNQLADDNKQFSFVTKMFSEKKHINVFRELEI